MANDINIDEIPKDMSLLDTKIEEVELAESFANYFKDKIDALVTNSMLDPNVYNGTPKIQTATNHNFMDATNVLKAIRSIKLKNSEGHDRMPQRILIDAQEILLNPLTILFNKIYHQKSIPEQWLMAKITPVHKKGQKTDITNYRPISNLCSGSKIFEKLILHRIQELEAQYGVDFTGLDQHGFKKDHSTITAALSIQSKLATALEQGKFSIMASLDLSSAFDVVNVNLLLKRLRIIGLPPDLIELIEMWLKNRTFFVTVHGRNSYIKISEVGTIQGSILGPFLYAVFVSPLFDMTDFTAYADDSQVIDSGIDLVSLIQRMEQKINIMIDWMLKSGLKVNESKTEICLFHKNDHPKIELLINNTIVKSKSTINVLGILFDSKLTWNQHIAQTINKTKRSLHSVKLIAKYMSKDEIRLIITSNVYSVLYYGSYIWLIPSLNRILLKNLKAASASALKLCEHYHNPMQSYDNLHEKHTRATPQKVMKYNHALLLYKLYNSNSMNDDWVRLNFQQNFNNRNQNFHIIDAARTKIGKNLLTNRLGIINDNISLELLNSPFATFKLKCKQLFLS